jgi:hypothetical protein
LRSTFPAVGSSDLFQEHLDFAVDLIVTSTWRTSVLLRLSLLRDTLLAEEVDETAGDGNEHKQDGKYVSDPGRQ